MLTRFILMNSTLRHYILANTLPHNLDKQHCPFTFTGLRVPLHSALAAYFAKLLYICITCYTNTFSLIFIPNNILVNMYVYV